MKMSGKMFMLFSIVTALLVFVNTLLSINSDLRTMRVHEAESLSVLANRMKQEIEQNIAIMEYGIEEMSRDDDFMSALMTIYQLGEAGDHTPEYLKAQNTLSSMLYRQPLNDQFFSVNVLTEEGFVLSSHFQKFEIAESYSDEVFLGLQNMSWCTDTTIPIGDSVVITPHPDPWSVSPARSAPVYTVWANAIYHGQKIGYLEVNALASELDNIFLIPDMSGFQGAAIFESRTNPRMRELYRAPENTIVYKDVEPGVMTICENERGAEYYVVSSYSRVLDLTVYAAQAADTFASSVRTTVLHHLLISLVILAASVAVVAVLSIGLTRSINRLTRKIAHTADASILEADPLHPQLAEKVTSPRDKEVRAVEDSFDELLLRLRDSTQSEMQLRESTLRSQLNTLQAQINPHFIYNTLNIISAKSMEAGNEEVIEICDHFAQMLRYSTDLRSKTAELREEIENVHNYLLLAKSRYEDKLTYEIDVPEAFMQVVLPKLSLQPIVENAISHGYQHSNGGIFIQIVGHVDAEGNLHLIIRDDGSGFDEAVLARLKEEFAGIERGELAQAENTTVHIGLVNTYRRLFYFSGKTVRMLVRNEGGAVVELIVKPRRET